MAAYEFDKKRYQLKTTNLFIIPQTREELKALIAEESNPEYKAEYEEALKQCNEDPDNGIYHTYWKAVIRTGEERGTHVGGLFIKGAPELGTIEISFRTFEPFRGRTYAVQGVRTFVEWAFAQKAIYEVVAVTDRENDFAIATLEKAAFVYREGDRHIQTYSIEKPKTSWVGIYIFFGAIVGAGFGVIFNSVTAGLILGIVLAGLFGGSMDVNENKEREHVTGKAIERGKRKRR